MEDVTQFSPVTNQNTGSWFPESGGDSGHGTVWEPLLWLLSLEVWFLLKGPAILGDRETYFLSLPTPRLMPQVY